MVLPSCGKGQTLRWVEGAKKKALSSDTSVNVMCVS